MKTNKSRTDKLIGKGVRSLRTHLKALRASGRGRTGRGLPDMSLNDGWSVSEYQRSFQEYGDGGDCWWEGCGR